MRIGSASRPLLLLVAPYFPPAYYGGAVQVYMGLLPRLSRYRVVVLADCYGSVASERAAWDAYARRELGIEVRRILSLELHFTAEERQSRRPFGDRFRYWLRRSGECLRFFRDCNQEWRALLEELQPDVVVCGGTYWAGWLMAKIPCEIPLLNYVHGEELTMRVHPKLLMPWMRWQQRRCLRKAARNIVVSGYTANLVARVSGAPSERISIVPNFVDTQRFRVSGQREEFRRWLNWNDHLVVLSLARLEARKGLDQALRSLAKLQQEQRLPKEVIYIIAGVGPERNSLEALAVSLGLAARVTFFGFVPDDDVPKLYESADVFLQPNREIAGDTEGFGIVFLEASACGLPVLGGIAGGTADAIEDGISGYRVDGDDVDAIAEVLVPLLWSEELRQQLGANGAARVRLKFTVEQAAERFESILDSCCMNEQSLGAVAPSSAG